MIKVIKEIKNNEYMYRLGYDLCDGKVYPYIEIFKNNNLCSGGLLSSKPNVPLFYFDGNVYLPYSDGYVNTMKVMFNKLREYNEIPQSIEEEYESLFLLYKLNNFKEI